MAEEDVPRKRQRGLDGEVIVRKSKDEDLYKTMFRQCATMRDLDRNCYPRPDEDNVGKAKFSNISSVKPFNDSDNKTCVRCEKSFFLTKVDDGTSREKCFYHKRRSYQGKPHQCCGRRRGSRGCRTADNHVHNDNLADPSNYVKTSKKTTPEDGNPGIYAIDGEMLFTVKGRELARFTIIDHNRMVIYDKFVKPDNKIIDYNTEFSGVTKKDIDGTTTTLKDVQDFCLEKFSSDTILIGHGVESELTALRLIHETIVDTALVFPHPRGLPHKRALRTLASTHLGRTIQSGLHCSKEDAMSCMDIMLRHVKW